MFMILIFSRVIIKVDRSSSLKGLPTAQVDFKIEEDTVSLSKVR